ncbi:hypothetical protein BRYFOR_07717 [Marvinbryantia formatexigens DSM 14469]|uniref:Uncharacterized protein n=1 Tax=Marvinbryantia formatexigens DSM 14469 TaxID=478749 RepID=C6LGF7_9FIRM|nr:hypothetical protein [Marvinbryantia formatexigens]EET60157.1 hypothetical protein BRYFOR_07717 [Marvinbryantia formatexigens DSM 14469]
MKSAEKEVAKFEAKKAKADQKAAEEAKKAEAETVLKKMLADGMSADELGLNPINVRKLLITVGVYQPEIVD